MRVFFFKLIDATVGAALCWLVGRGRHWLHREPPVPPDPLAATLRRVLVIRPGGLGDMVQLLPALRALRARFPAAAVDVVCERRNAGVLRLSGLADAIACYDARPLAVLAGLWRARYDVAIDTEQFHHLSALMALAGGAPVRIGFKINPGRNPLYTHLVTYELDGWEAAQFMRLLAPLGITGPEPRVEGILQPSTPRLSDQAPRTKNPEPRTQNQEPRTKNPEPRTQNQELPPILLHSGSTTRYKAWPEDRWVALIGRLQAATARPVVLVGGRTDAALAARIAARCRLGAIKEAAPVAASLCDAKTRRTAPWLQGFGDAPVEGAAPEALRISSLAGKTTLEELVEALRRAALFVGGDSGLAHLAVAAGAPTVVLFGPSDSRKWGARGPGHAVVRHELACAPCAMFGYHKLCRSIACMDGITVDTVAAACLERLGGAGCQGDNHGGLRRQ